MKKLFWVLVPILCVPFLCGVALGSKPKDFHVLEITETDDVVIDAGNNITKPKEKFDIFKTGRELTAFDDPNKIIGEIKIPIARILITQTTPTYSVGTILSRIDGSGSRPEISNISKGMICRKTTKETLKAEKQIYKNQKKALKQQKQKPFNIQDLKLGMQKSEVEQICNGSLELISFEIIPDSNGCSKAVYRMWPNETKTPIGIRCVSGTPSAVWAGGKDIRPYLLTFKTYPPLAKEDVDKFIELAKIEPNNQQIARQIFTGFVYTPLIEASLDTAAYQEQLAEYQRNIQNYRELTQQRQPPTTLQMNTQPVIIQQDNSNFWQERQARQEYMNNLLRSRK